MGAHRVTRLVELEIKRLRVRIAVETFFFFFLMFFKIDRLYEQQTN